jgi:hypothetical protein
MFRHIKKLSPNTLPIAKTIAENRLNMEQRLSSAADSRSNCSIGTVTCVNPKYFELVPRASDESRFEPGS